MTVVDHGSDLTCICAFQGEEKNNRKIQIGYMGNVGKKYLVGCSVNHAEHDLVF